MLVASSAAIEFEELETEVIQDVVEYMFDSKLIILLSVIHLHQATLCDISI